MPALPDPTIDLDWSGYAGSIQEHFAKNAKDHPDRICVIETKSYQSPKRSFTYQQIFEASNVVAHYLHDAGITNDDVVMIWAHRSVDLVVSIMGVLAAGATICILDPAYPPLRQKVYLDCAKPCGLIILARALEEGGPLAPLVRSYIDEELHLKSEIPSLRLFDDGTLEGDKLDNREVFYQVHARASSPPDVLVGPDSIPTLSFTSGSSGATPKTVEGRHFSLTKYFGWMAGRFGLSSESRFTMLSGIAHDPIQRDIFTPLFLGAQLIVPAREDIQHERLAEWFGENMPTVSHLTPAMGQILVGGATAEFPSLERAFFVGDILTTRDCRQLRSIGVNTHIVSMYGTTESQRSVSYYEIPSRSKDPDFMDKLKDIVPAGTGMKDVQLLVINQQDQTKLCEIGEVGEIYVRAAGLAEGYKGDEALNKQKFLMNWFTDNKKWVEADKTLDKGEPWRQHYKGPRDRLYRTGDLGRYIEPNGCVECTGRADDQVKIRGFRIELNDIDSNLGQNPLIRDCKTLVRRNRNEEPILVSYIVPEFKAWLGWLKDQNLDDIEDAGTEFGPTRVYFKRFRRIQAEIREHLKDRLPSYAVPTIYIVLKKLPLNPNGKVDKPNLPFPDIAERTEKVSDEDLKRWESLTETEQLVASKWATRIQGLEPKTIRPENDFFDLGGHSLSAQQMCLDIKALVPNISIEFLFQNPSLAGFSAKVDQLLNPTKHTNRDNSGVIEKDSDYSRSLEVLLKRLPSKFKSADPATIRASSNPTVFLTGATGFLGSYIVKDILERNNPEVRLIAHVRGVTDSKAAIQRLRKSLEGYGLWRDEWSARLSCVIGDLSKQRLGIEERTWQVLSNTVDSVIHNGAAVHWVKRYQDMLDSNVISTIEAMQLVNEGKKAKTFAFVSSTSVLDTDHYIKLSEEQVRTGQNDISEEDDLEGSRTGLGTGYGQTKWVSEQLVREAGKRGLRGSVIRPGYILGDSNGGVINQDDFLVRLMKGCIQLKSRPRIINTINAVPVNHAARVCVASALNPLENGVHVVHVTGHPRLRMNEFLSSLEFYGYTVPEVRYNVWKEELEKYVTAGGQEKDQEQHALLPLLHFCINDLPATTRAPELNDRNAYNILKLDADWTGVDESAGYGITRENVGSYLRYLASIQFVSWPTSKGRPLPQIDLSPAQMEAIGAVGGRGGSSTRPS